VTALTPAQAGPEFLLARNREHWGIENGLHYRRDVTLGEDASRIRAGQSPRLFAAIGNAVTSVLNRAGHANHAAARRDLGLDRPPPALLNTPHPPPETTPNRYIARRPPNPTLPPALMG